MTILYEATLAESKRCFQCLCPILKDRVAIHRIDRAAVCCMRCSTRISNPILSAREFVAFASLRKLTKFKKLSDAAIAELAVRMAASYSVVPEKKQASPRPARDQIIEEIHKYALTHPQFSLEEIELIAPQHSRKTIHRAAQEMLGKGELSKRKKGKRFFYSLNRFPATA